MIPPCGVPFSGKPIPATSAFSIADIIEIRFYLSGREKTGADHRSESQRKKRNFPYPLGSEKRWQQSNGDHEGYRF